MHACFADHVESKADRDAIAKNLQSELGGLGAWRRVVNGQNFIAIDNTKGPNDPAIVALRQLILQASNAHINTRTQTPSL